MTSLLSTSSFHCHVKESNSKVGLDFSARTLAAFKNLPGGLFEGQRPGPISHMAKYNSKARDIGLWVLIL